MYFAVAGWNSLGGDFETLCPFKSVEDGSDAQRAQQWREVGLGAQILRDIGVGSIVNLASSPRSFVGLSGFGIEIADTQPLE